MEEDIEYYSNANESSEDSEDIEDNDEDELDNIEETPDNRDEETDDEEKPDIISNCSKTKYFNGFYEYDAKELEVIKENNLKKPGRFEIFGILLFVITLLKSGAYTLVDQSKIGIPIYDNFENINEETMACIALFLRCVGICVKKEGKILNVDNYDPKYIIYVLKLILRIHGNNNYIVRVDTFKKLFPDIEIYKDTF